MIVGSFHILWSTNKTLEPGCLIGRWTVRRWVDGFVPFYLPADRLCLASGSNAFKGFRGKQEMMFMALRN
jgi:hypothetical protein